MRRAALSLALLAITAPALADDAPPPPAELGVLIEKPAGDGLHYSHGSGVYLGEGLVLTAEHVIHYDMTNDRVTVLLDGVRDAGTIVDDGIESESVDLALIKLGADELSPKRATQPRVRVCGANPGTNQKATVAALGAVSEATTFPQPMVREGAETYSTAGKGDWTNLLTSGYHPGNSGGGVFDPRSGCLWGILSFELGGKLDSGQQVDFTAFVPATRVAAFLDHYRHGAASAAGNGVVK